MVIDHLETDIGHRRVTAAIAHRLAMDIVRRRVTASDRRPVVAIAHRPVAVIGLRQVVEIVRHRTVAGLPATVGIDHRKADNRAVTVRNVRKPSLLVNKPQDKRRDIRGVCHLPQGHQPCPVRA
jgi:hypothetical protein